MADYVIVGSGINALVAASLLALKGRQVLVLERNDRTGGCMRTEEATLPGFSHDVMATTFVLFLLSPAYAALAPELEKRGLQFVHPEIPTGVLRADGSSLLLSFGEGRWNAGNLAIKPSRLNPLSGLGRMFGVTGWIELAKGLAKVALLGTIAWVWAASHLPALFGLGRGALGPALASGWAALLSLLFALTAGLVGIALVDFPIQWLRRHNRLRMSDQDMRDEHKETEGSPEKKAAIRQRQRAIAKGGVQHAMREAQFVLTNPSHFAVAMAYDPAKAGAPLVLAKGRGEKALAMRELAAELAVPTLEYPALARSVYFTTREHQVIREELYAAVASVLAFVLSLKRGDHPARPAIEVPIALRFDAEGRLDPAAA